MDKAEYNGEEMIKIRSEMMIALRRSGLLLQLSKTKEAYLGMDLLPRHFISTSNETGEDKLVEGKVENGTVTLRTTLSGKTTEESKPIPKDIVFEETLGFIALSRGLKVGDQYDLNVFNLELLEPVRTTVAVAGEDVIEYNGKQENVFVLDYTLDLMGGIQSREWLGPDGTTYKMEMGAMGIEMIRTDKQTALGEVGDVDVIINTKIFPQGEQPESGSDYFKARVTLSSGNLSETFMNTERQKVSLGPDSQTGILEVRTLDISEQSALSLPIADSENNPIIPVIPLTTPLPPFIKGDKGGQGVVKGELSEFLKATMYVQADDESIKKRAQEIIGSETNSWRAAILICKWVHDKIWNKNLKVGFGSAKQTLESLEGDCTEHTVLFIALARAVGIPSRICAGLVYQRDAFYYHFWPEVYVGKWVSMEPTLGQIQADATHIQLAGGKLESESALEFGEGVLRTLNRLQIERMQ
jgi:transglutaminase-like putative cysteine protease